MAWHKICQWNISDCPRNPWWDDAAWLDVAPCWHLPRNPQNSSESPWALYPWGKQANTKKKGGALETAKQQRRFQDQAQSHNQNLNYIHQKKHGCRHLRQTWGILKGVLSEHRWYLGQTDSPIPLPPRSSTKCSRRARRRELALQLEIAWRRWHTL